MYVALGICLAFAALLTINAFASLATAALWRLLAPLVVARSARSRADILFALRIGAPALALLCVTFVLVPSYLTYEPHSTSEVVSMKLAVLAIVSIAGITFAVWRALRSWFATRALQRAWLAISDRIMVAGIGIPTFCFTHSFPVLAVIGTVRPRLFIAEHVLRSLSEDELAAAIAHERGHLAAYDNFKRTVLRACRHLLLLVPFGRFLDRQWAETAECAADEHAARQSPHDALALASALVKIARMVPTGTNTRMPAAAFLVDTTESRGIKARVRRLLALASMARTSDRPDRSYPWPAITVTSLLVAGIALASSSQSLAFVHAVVERAVHILS